VGDVLRDEKFFVEYGGELLPKKVKALHERAPETKVFVGSGMTRGTGVSDVKYVMDFAASHVDGDIPVTLGVQLQANTLKVFLEMDDKTKARKAADALWQPSVGNRIWYDFRGVKGGSDEFPKNKTFNQYGGTFLYRSVQLGPTSPKSLVEIIVKYVRLIRDNEVALRQQLGKMH
jgi:hypothetical protein